MSSIGRNCNKTLIYLEVYDLQYIRLTLAFEESGRGKIEPEKSDFDI